jgi:hypothetical protein
MLLGSFKVMSDPSNTVKLHLFSSTRMVSNLDMQKSWITGVFFENGLHGQPEVGKNFYKWLF